jgi:hypothetical protein
MRTVVRESKLSIDGQTWDLQRTTSAPSDKGISGLNHTPYATAVYASCSALLPPHATLASRRPAKPYLGRTCTG